jgi:hypothetical protein
VVSKIEITDEIKSAFEGVSLDGGISLNQTKVIDNYGRGCSDEQFAALPLSEVTDDWTKIPTSAIDEAHCLAHLDRKGFRYYLPGLMIRLLDTYDPGSMMTIGTLSSLYPKTESQIFLYSLLSPQQARAIAHFLQALPRLVELYGEDVKVVERAYRNYWSKYLASK